MPDRKRIVGLGRCDRKLSEDGYQIVISSAFGRSAGVAGLTAAWRRHVDAHRAEDLGPVRDGEAGQDDDECAQEGLETRTAGRTVVARTVDIGHYGGVSQNQSEHRPRALLASPKRR